MTAQAHPAAPPAHPAPLQPTTSTLLWARPRRGRPPEKLTTSKLLTARSVAWRATAAAGGSHRPAGRAPRLERIAAPPQPHRAARRRPIACELAASSMRCLSSPRQARATTPPPGSPTRRCPCPVACAAPRFPSPRRRRVVLSEPRQTRATTLRGRALQPAAADTVHALSGGALWRRRGEERREVRRWRLGFPPGGPREPHGRGSGGDFPVKRHGEI